MNAVGALGPRFRELDDHAMRAALVVESRAALERESGDVILSGTPVYAELGELLAQKKPAPQGGRSVFKSVGIAIEDLAAALLVCEAGP